MTQTAATETHRKALLSLLLGLFALVGLSPDGPVLAVPKAVRLKVLRSLRPAESALRRLIFVLSRRMSVPESRTRSAPVGTFVRGEGKGDRVPPFRLFDPRKPFPELSQGVRRPLPGPGPRIFFFDGSDTPPQPEPEKPVRDPDDGARLAARMRSLHKALLNMPREARRLLRAMAKRAKAPPGPKRYGPLRPGMPPGFRAGRAAEVDDILCECALMAQWVLEQPDTS